MAGPGLTARPLLRVQVDDYVAQSGLQQNRHGARASSATSPRGGTRNPSSSTATRHPRRDVSLRHPSSDTAPFGAAGSRPPGRCCAVRVGSAPSADLLRILVPPGRLARKPVPQKGPCTGFCAPFISISRMTLFCSSGRLRGSWRAIAAPPSPAFLVGQLLLWIS